MDVRGELLLKAGLVDVEELRAAEEIRDTLGGSLLEILVDRGSLTQRQFVDALAQRFGIQVLEELSVDAVDPQALALLPPDLCREMGVLPLGLRGSNGLRLAVTDPTDLGNLDDVRFMTGLQVEPVLVSRADLLAVLAELHPEEERLKDQIRALEGFELTAAPVEESVEIDISKTEQAPVIALVNLLLKQGIVGRASDIHLEPKEKHTRVRFRIDGVLVEHDPIPRRYSTAVMARIKVLSHLDITERRIPQDGAFSVNVAGRRVDFRVSTFPTAFGEKTVLRILDGSSTQLSLDQLGFSERDKAGIDEIMRYNEGIFLVTGPTGSGKSTTLYTLLAAMDSPERNIVTLEDPVEYKVETLTQGQVNPKVGFSFASGLRSILRQDPDVILLGEIRDLETGRIAVQASLTGHLVFSTLHTNSACEAVMRLQDMGIEPFLLAASLRGVLAQRLSRQLCRRCREAYHPTQEIRELYREQKVTLPPDCRLYRPGGCKACNSIGYTGRMGLFELFRMTPDAQHVVARGGENTAVIATALKDGFRTMRQDGLLKAAAGLTSVEEIYRVT